MRTIYRAAFAAAICVSPIAANAGIIPTTARMSVEQEIRFSIEGAANFAGFQNGGTALHDSSVGMAFVGGSNSEQWSSGCEGGQTCTLDLNSSVMASASDGSAVSKRIESGRKLFIQVEDTASLTVLGVLTTFEPETALGDGGSAAASASGTDNSFILAEDMIRRPNVIALQNVMSIPMVPTLPSMFSLEQGEMMTFDLPFGEYSIEISGGTLSVSASQTGSSVDVSEPASLALFGIALAGLAGTRRRMK